MPAQRVLMSWLARALFTSAVMRSMIAGGVPLIAHKPYVLDTS